jgi:hypothetical protein
LSNGHIERGSAKLEFATKRDAIATQDEHRCICVIEMKQCSYVREVAPASRAPTEGARERDKPWLRDRGFESRIRKYIKGVGQFARVCGDNQPFEFAVARNRWRIRSDGVCNDLLTWKRRAFARLPCHRLTKICITQFRKACDVHMGRSTRKPDDDLATDEPGHAQCLRGRAGPSDQSRIRLNTRCNFKSRNICAKPHLRRSWSVATEIEANRSNVVVPRHAPARHRDSSVPRAAHQNSSAFQEARFGAVSRTVGN